MQNSDSLLVRFAYAIQGFKGYQHTKSFFYSLIEAESSPYSKYFHYFMIFLIFSSVFILIDEVKHEISFEIRIFNDYIISLFFLVEYLLRIWLHGSISEIIIKQYEKDQLLARSLHTKSIIKHIISLKLEYIKSPSAIIDFLAIMPFFHELRLLRLFILFRVFKLFRYTGSMHTFVKVFHTKKFEFFTLLIFTSIIVFVSAVMIYVMEANVKGTMIHTFFEAVYWSLVTISTVGFGDYSPVTQEGQVVAMMIIVSGVGVISFATSIIVSSFTEQLDDIKENRDIESIRKLKNFYLILGYNHLGEHVAGKLKRLGNKIVVLDERANLAELAKKHGYTAFNYNPGLLSSYKRLNINLNSQVKAILSLESSDIENVYNVLTIRSINKKTPILSILHNKSNHKKLSLSGVNDIIYTQELIGMVAKEFGGEPVAFEAINALRSEANGMVFEELFITDYLLKHFHTIAKLELIKYHILCIGIQRAEQEFIFNPIPTMELEHGDILLLTGMKSLIVEMKKHTRGEI